MFQLFNYNYYSKYQKTMQKSMLVRLEHTQSSFESHKDIKPCLEQQNVSEKSTILQETTQKILHTTFMSDPREGEQQKDQDSLSDVSLEDDILHEHKSTLEQLFAQSSLFFNKKKAIRNSKEIKNGTCDEIFKQITLEHYLYLQFNKLRARIPGLIALFQSYLRAEKIFHRFLQHLYYSYPKHIVHQIFRYLFYTWQLYYPCLQMRLSITEAKSVGKHIYQKMLKCEEESRLHSQFLEEEVKQQRRRLIKVMVVTVVLVMEKCFSNPYHIPQNNISKPHSEQPEQMSECSDNPHKIIKRD